MEDVSGDEIVEVHSLITNRIIEYLEYVHHSLKEFENEYLPNDLNTKDLVECTNEIQQWQENYVEDISTKELKNSNYLEILNEETEKLEHSRDSMQKRVSKSEKEVELLKRKLAHVNKQKENLTVARDEVQICKLLTNTSFIYKGSSISGYVAGLKIDSFELDPETLTKKDIINNLYNKVKKASCTEEKH